MFRIHASWVAIVVLLISAGDARAQHRGAHHAAVGVHHGSTGVGHHPIAGDALNAAAVVLGHHKPFRLAPARFNATLPPECVGNFTFKIAADGLRINLRELATADQWPLGLCGNLYAPACDAYETAIDRVIAESRQGGVTPRTVRQVDLAVERLRLKLDRVPPLDFIDRNEAELHLARVTGTAKMLHGRHAGEILQELETSPPRTLAALLGFMDRHNLWFGPAQTARQRKAHQDFYPILAGALDKVVGPAKDDQARVAARVAKGRAGRLH